MRFLRPIRYIVAIIVGVLVILSFVTESDASDRLWNVPPPVIPAVDEPSPEPSPEPTPTPTPSPSPTPTPTPTPTPVPPEWAEIAEDVTSLRTTLESALPLLVFGIFLAAAGATLRP
jgi:hypothetical protein